MPPLDSLEPVADADDVVRLAEQAREVYVEESLSRYVVALLRQTRADTRLYLGASPRAGIALLRVAKARALADGRDYLVPDDVKAVAAVGALAPADPRRRRRARPASAARRSSPKRSRRPPSRCDSADDLAATRVLALGVGVYFARVDLRLARALPGRRPGSCFAVALAVGWVRLSTRPPHVPHGTAPRATSSRATTSGSTSSSTRPARVPPPTLVAHERPGGLGERRVELHRVGGRRLARRLRAARGAARPVRVRDRAS